MLEGPETQLKPSGTVSDTIFAPATGAGRAAIAIIRISGPAAHEALAALAGGTLPPWRELSLRELKGPDGQAIDKAMVVAFPEGGSYTGEPMAEVHCHGSRAVVGDLLTALSAMPRCRIAKPGEFTQRAFLHGRMDLSEVEGLADLIASETSEQRRQALRIHSGAVSRQTAEWRSMLLRARALVEVTIDWADEEVPEDVAPEVRDLLDRLEASMAAELARSAPAERMRCGFEVAIVGPPNVGKSSLLNAIAGREAAIVSEVAGTTRDVIEVRFDLSGLPVSFLDTAGLREACDPVERLGVDRALQRAAAADLRIVMASPDTVLNSDAGLWREGDVRVWSKSDLAPGPPGDISISTMSNEGIDELLGVLRDGLGPRAAGAGIVAHARQRFAVEEALRCIRRCRASFGVADAEHSAEDLRLASDALSRLVGETGVEAILDEVFGAFCLGK
jgi:tRNA modification GTPase